MTSCTNKWDPQEEAYCNRGFNPDIGQKDRRNSKNSKNCFTLYVTGIPPEFSNRALGNLFESYGQVLHANILPPKHPDSAPRAGFVEFGTLREADNAIRNLNGTRFGRFIFKVSHARSSQRKETSSYEQLIQKLEKGPLIDSDLKMLIQEADDDFAGDTSFSSNGFDGKGDANRCDERTRCEPISKSKPAVHRSQSPDRTRDYPPASNDTSQEKCGNGLGKNAEACRVCGRLTVTVCSSCNIVHYCSEVCQKKDWPEHKKICKKLAEKEELLDDEPLICVDQTICNNIAKNLKGIVPNHMEKSVEKMVASIDMADVTKKPSPKKCMIKMSATSICVGKELDFIVSDLDANSGMILCQNADKASVDSLNKLQSALNKHYTSKSGMSLSAAKLGDFCATVYSEDGQWYRAVVEQLCGENQAIVQFVDYGNSEVVQCDKLKVLEDDFYLLPAFNIKCKLSGAVVDVQWGNDAVNFLSNLLQQSHLLVKATITELDNNFAFVKLKVGKVEINEEMFKRGLIKAKLGSIDTNNNIPPPPAKAEERKLASKPVESNVESQKAVDSKEIKLKSTTKKVPSLSANFSVGVKMESCVDKMPTSKSDKVPLKIVTIPTDVFTLVISHVEDPGKFFCQVVHEELIELNNTMERLTSMFTSKREKADYSPGVGDICAAFFPEDGLWYRAEVLETDKPNMMKVRYIDFGNTENLEVDQIQPLPSEFTKLPVQAFPATLSNCFPLDYHTWSEDATLLLKSCQNTSLEGKLCKDVPLDGVASLIISIDENVTFNSHLVSSGLATDKPIQEKFEVPLEVTDVKMTTEKEKEMEQTPHVPSPVESKWCSEIENVQPVMGNVSTINITASTKPGFFHCQLVTDELANLPGMVDSLTTYCSGNEVAFANPIPGQFCIAYFADDQSWYRACITDVVDEQRSAHVTYVDYGNTALVSLDKIRPLPAKFGNFPAQALACCLADAKPRPDFNEEFIGILQTCMSKPLEAQFVNEVKGEYIVKVPHLLNILIKHNFAEYSL